MRLLILSVTALLTLTTCAAPKPLPRPPVALPTNTTVLPQPPVRITMVQPKGHWTDWPMEAGSWTYAQDDRGSIARFGMAGKDAAVMLRCDKGRSQVFLSRAADVGGSMTLRTSSTSKSVAMRPTGTQPAYAASEIMVGDAILDAMAFSRGRVAFELPGVQNIAVPVWSEIGRVIEDCRR